MTSGKFHVVHAGPPCNTWSSARFILPRRQDGPKPLRTRDYPYGGDPDYPLGAADAKKVKDHNLILNRTVELLKMAHHSSSRATIGMENPADPKVHPSPLCLLLQKPIA